MIKFGTFAAKRVRGKKQEKPS